MEHVANKNANDFGTLKSIIKPPYEERPPNLSERLRLYTFVISS